MVEVVNLDGVVDSRAHSSLRERRLADYARERHIDYLVDWEFNIQSFLRASERASPMPASLELVGRAIPQGSDRFLIYRVRWGTAGGPS
jgi:hypothetical protein